MTWGNFKILVKNKVQFEGEEEVDLESIAVGSDAETRIQHYLDVFLMVTREHYKRRLALTLTSFVSSQEVDLRTACPTGFIVYEPTIIWINGKKIEKVSVDIMQDEAVTPTQTAGEPNSWADMKDWIVEFDKPLGADYGSSYIEGYYLPAAYTADNNVVNLTADKIDIAAKFIAAGLMEGVVSSDSGLQRLKRYEAISRPNMGKQGGSNVARKMRGGVRGGRKGW